MDYVNWNRVCLSVRRGEGNTFIQYLMDAGVDANALNWNGETMLSYAAKCGNLQTISFLVQKGADGNVTNSDGSKPLHVAAKYGHKNIVKFFLDLGIFVDSCDNHNCTPLHYVAADIPVETARESYQELVYFLVDSGADLNAVNRDGCTPLLLAARKTRRDIVELLMKLGANVECCDEGQWTVLHYSSRNGWSGIVRTLVEGRFDIDLNAKTLKGDTPLLLAFDPPHTDIVKLLIESGANVECKYFKDWTLLHRACRRGWLDIVKSLVNKGCDIDVKNSYGDTPVLLAAESSHFNSMVYLIESGADVKCCDDNKDTLLHYSCEQGKLDITKFLVNKGCDIDVKNSDGDTPLHFAAKYSYFNIVEYLIESGADVKSCNNHKYTVLHYSSKKGKLDIVKSLLNKGCDVDAKNSIGNTSLLLAAVNSHFNIVEYLIDSGADVKCCCDDGRTVLHHACSKGWLDVVKSVVKKEHDLINVQERDLKTPLHDAIESRNLEIMEHLLKAGADCNIENIRGFTAFNSFIRRRFGLEGIILFIESGAYFRSIDYVAVNGDPSLKKGILRNMKLCTQAIINKFNNSDLPKIYKIPGVSEILPSISKLKVVNSTNAANNIADSVNYEIQTKGYCNVWNVRPLMLNILSVRSLVDHYDSSASLG